MEQNFTDEQLDQQLGTSSKQFSKFRVLSIDNGEDIVGTNATGNFIEKQYDSETQKTTRIQFADVFPGIILASKAQVADKSKYPSWRTGEFDPSNVEEMIEVFPLQNGKFIKEPNGDTKKYTMTYRELKKAKSTPNPDGSFQSTYNYFIILYVGVDGEVMKLKFKGASRGNYFDYNKAVAQLGAKIYNVQTVFSTYKDTGTGKFAIKFDVEKDEQGIPVSVDPEEVKNMRIQVAKSMQPFQGKALGAPQTRAQIGQPSAPRTIDNSEIRESEIVGGPKDDNIDLKEMDNGQDEVPFTGVL